MNLRRLSTFRTGLVVVLIMTALAGVSVLIVQKQLQKGLMDQAQVQLNAEMQNLAALYDQRRIIAVRQAIEFRGVEGTDLGRIYLLMDRNNRVLAGNIDSWPNQIAPEKQGFDDGMGQVFTIGQDQYLVSALELRGGFPLLVGVSLGPAKGTLTGMRGVFALFGGLMVVAGIGAAYGAAQRVRRRLKSVNVFLDDVGTNAALTERLPRQPDPEDEFGQLNAHINAMLDRISHLLDAHHRLGNTVAHEMRTPLARIQARLSQLDLDQALRAGLDDEIRSTIRLFDSLLSIAQMDAQAEDRTGLNPVDLSAIVAEIAELYQPVAEDGDRALSLDLTPGAVVLGDQGLLAQLVSNLIENGLKYTAPGDEISLHVAKFDDRVKLTVRDTGPGLDQDIKETVFAPFSRGQNTIEKPGHGLGLSLVRAIALRHGAILRLPNLDKGFAIEMDCILFKEKD